MTTIKYEINGKIVELEVERGFPSVFIIRLFGHLDAWDGYF